MTQLHIVDDFLTEDQMLEIYSSKFLFENSELENTGSYNWNEIKIFHPIINYLSEYFDLSNAVTYEIWQQKNTRPFGWHHDKDEKLWHQSGELLFPILTSIFYLDVNIISGGNLFLEDDTVIEPVTNRLVSFGPGVEHYVEPYSGSRHSIIINPWDRFLAS